MEGEKLLVLERLRQLQPMANLSEAHLRELVENCWAEFLPRGSRPEAFAWESDHVLYVAQGEMRLSYPDGGSEVLVGACGKARWPLGQSGPRPLRGQAITDVVLIHVSELALEQLLTWHQSLYGVAVQTDTWSGHQSLPAASLTKGAFAHLPAAHIEALLAAFQSRLVQPGELIVREGEPGDAYYLIASGRAQVFRQVGEDELEVAELGPGQAFGEESLISGEARNASVRMKTAGRLLRLAKPDFQRLLEAPLLRGVAFREAQALVDAGGCWLDVRYPAECARDGLPGALNIPLNELRNAFSLLSRERTYVVYCRAGRRSAAAAFLLAQQGFDARWLERGLASPLPDQMDRAIP